MQHKQENLVHIISVLNVTRYATQVNRQYINLVMDAVERTHQDITTLYNITSSLYTSQNYQQIVLYICSILANLRDSLYYMRQVTMHTMDYIDAATTGILSPHVLLVEYLQKMLIHIKEVLPFIMHLPVSPEDTHHFYRYLCTLILITDEQFLLVIDVPIQDHIQQLEIYEAFNLVIPHRNLSAHYNIDSKYFRHNLWWNKSRWKFQNGSSLHVNRLMDSFCSINIPLQPLANPPSCITTINAMNKAGIEKRCSLQIRTTNGATIFTQVAPNVWILTSAPTVASTGIMIICPEEAPRFIKTQTPIHILCIPPACSATPQHFHLPPHYETHQLTINISFNTANLNVMNISSPEFRIWQHLEHHWNGTQFHYLVNIPSVPIDQLCKHMVSSNGPITPFMQTNVSIDDTASIWALFSHTGIYVTAIGLLILAGLGIFSCYFFWCQPARLTPGSLWHTIVDDDVEAAPIYRCDGKTEQPVIRPHENYNLCMKWEPTWMESWQKQQTQSKAVPTAGSLDRNSKI